MPIKTYQDLLLEHYKNPRNYGALESPDFSSGEYNPSCGDSVALQGTIFNGCINKIGFVGKGCVISLATASLLTEKCLTKTLDELLLMDKDDIQSMIGMELGPIRLKCALLPLYALHKGLKEYNIKK